MKRLLLPILLTGLGFIACAAAAQAADGCGRLKTGDTFDDLNKILDCIEARIDATAGSPVAASNVAVYSEEMEPNDRIGEANRITLGATVTGKLKDANEFDIFTFVAPDAVESVRVILRQTHPSGFYFRATVYDNTETVIGKKNGYPNVTMSLPIETAPGKPYYVTITCWATCGKNMPYELLVRED